MGYNFFNTNSLTDSEIEYLIDCWNTREKKREKESKKKSRKSKARKR